MRTKESLALSVILVTPDRYERLRPTIQRLRQQTACRQIELVLVAPRLADLCVDETVLSEFAAFQLVETEEITSTGKPRADGVWAATAPIVVFGEDHCWPEPDWAAALIEAHERPGRAVGPTLINANPSSLASCASFLLNFGPCAERASGGVCDYIPTHNSSYKTEVLRRYGDRLAFALEVEGLLQQEFMSTGGELFLEAKARAAHINISKFHSFLLEQYWGSYFFWASRVRWEEWRWPRRWLWAAGTPALIPLRLLRALKSARRIGLPARRFPGLSIALTSGVLSLASGALFGILLGPRNHSAAARVRMEFHRRQYLRPEESHLLPDD